MKRGEVTLMVLADFSKAFGTIKYNTVLKKLGLLGFSKDYLKWTIQYLTGRKQFVQIDDNKSSIVLKLRWLPVKEQREWNLLKATHKAIYNTNWPNYLKLNIFQHDRCLRSSNGLQLERPLISNTLETRDIIYTRALELLN